MYFNFSTFWATNRWQQRSFLRAWWRLYAGDRRWAPPVYPALARMINSSPLYARLDAQPLYMEAMPRRASGGGFTPNAPLTASVVFEEPVAAAILQIDRRRQDGAAYLGLMRCANDEETGEQLLQKAFERAAELGCSRLIGPTGVLPNWQPGALLNHFNRTPPGQTPYNPPYLGELLDSLMQPWLETVLLEAPVSGTPVSAPGASAPEEPAQMEQVSLSRLAGDLLPLLAQAIALDDAFPPPDELEAQALLGWLAQPLAPQAWLASVAGAPAGLLLLQPDLAPLLQKTGGGRRWLGRGYLALRKRAPVPAGRLLVGAVAPAWRGRGIGRQLWRHALHCAQIAGWQTLTAGPVLADSAAARFLAVNGAEVRQRYRTSAILNLKFGHRSEDFLGQ